jgi:hypothetical protein
MQETSDPKQGEISHQSNARISEIANIGVAFGRLFHGTSQQQQQPRERSPSMQAHKQATSSPRARTVSSPQKQAEPSSTARTVSSPQKQAEPSSTARTVSSPQKQAEPSSTARTVCSPSNHSEPSSIALQICSSDAFHIQKLHSNDSLSRTQDLRRLSFSSLDTRRSQSEECKEALELLNGALTTQVGMLGNEHLDVDATLQNIGTVLCPSRTSPRPFSAEAALAVEDDEIRHRTADPAQYPSENCMAGLWDSARLVKVW